MTLQTIEPVLYLPDDTPFYPEPGDDRHGLRLFLRAAGLVLVCFAVYLPVSIWGGLVWQDDLRVTQNIFLWSWGGLAGAWAHPLAGWYRPLAQSVLWAQHHFFGIHPLGYHLVSILFHGVNAGLLWMVLRRLNVRGAWLGAALFAVHPIQVQSVAWVSQQSHLLGTGFLLGAVWTFLRLSGIRPPLPEEFAPSPGHDWGDLLPAEPVRRLYALAIVFAVAASLSDPIGVVLPIVLLLLVWWKQGSVTRTDWLRLAPFFAVAIAGAALIAVMVARSHSVDPEGSGPALTIAQRFLVDARAIAWYAGTIAWPFPLLFVYARWYPISWASWQIVFPAGLVVALAVAWAARRRAGRWPLAAVLLFIAILLPALGSVLGTSAPAIYVADHWAYLAVAIPAAAAGALLATALTQVRFPWVARGLRVAVAAACVGGLGFIAWQQQMIYDQEASVWKDTLAQQPGSSVAVNAYARLFLKEGNDLKASELLEKTPVSGPPDVSTLQTRGQIYLIQGRYAEASRALLEAHHLAPDDEQVTTQLAESYVRDGRSDEAMRVYQDAIHGRAADASVLNDMGLALVAQGKLDEAIAQYDAALKVNPRFIAAKINLAQALDFKAAKARTFEEARPSLERAARQLNEVVAIDPHNYYAFYNAGVLFYRLHDFPHAEQMFRAAVTVQPNAAEAWDRLGIVQAAQGKSRLSEAVWNFDRAVRLRPDFHEAQEHLERARQSVGATNAK
jgi:tetratricopeptide (TPR) repeat protein